MFAAALTAVQSPGLGSPWRVALRLNRKFDPCSDARRIALGRRRAWVIVGTSLNGDVVASTELRADLNSAVCKYTHRPGRSNKSSCKLAYSVVSLDARSGPRTQTFNRDDPKRAKNRSENGPGWSIQADSGRVQAGHEGGMRLHETAGGKARRLVGVECKKGHIGRCFAQPKPDRVSVRRADAMAVRARRFRRSTQPARKRPVAQSGEGDAGGAQAHRDPAVVTDLAEGVERRDSRDRVLTQALLMRLAPRRAHSAGRLRQPRGYVLGATCWVSPSARTRRGSARGRVDRRPSR